MDQPKLNKALLSRISSEAKARYIERGNSDGSLYLDPNEIIARAYAEATLAVLQSTGFILERKPLSTK